MRKRTTVKSQPEEKNSIEMANVRRRNEEDADEYYHSKNRGDVVDGPRALGGQPFSQPLNTVTTVSAPSGFRLAQHMTIAGSFLDFALFVADVEHLKFLLDAGPNNINYYTMLISLLIASLVLQLIVVFLLFIVGFKKPAKTTVTTRNAADLPLEEQPNNGAVSDNTNPNQNQNTVIEEVINNGESTILNHIIICLVTIIAIINVFVTVFGDRSATKMIENFKIEARNHTAAH